MENPILKIKVTKSNKSTTYEISEDGIYVGDDYIYIADITVDNIKNPTRVTLWGYRKTYNNNMQMSQLQTLDRMDKIEILETDDYWSAIL
jgi:hypothetical protein